MIDLYTSPTPNGWKASVTLEELALPYNVLNVDLMKGEQKTPEFRVDYLYFPDRWVHWELWHRHEPTSCPNPSDLEQSLLTP